MEGRWLFFQLVLFSSIQLLGGVINSVLLTLNALDTDNMVFPEDAGTINVTISLSGPRTVNTTVQLSISNSHATAGIDFTPEAFNEVTFAPTDANRSFLTVPITIMDDQVVESVEIFQLTATFQDPDSAQMVSSNPLLIGIDDNGDSIRVGFREDMAVTDEFTPLPICMDVLSGSLQRFVELEVETSPITASSLKDYIPMKLVFTFTSSEKSMCRFIPVLPDGIPENNETLGIRVKRSSSVEIIPDITGVIADSDGVILIFCDPLTGQPSSDFNVTVQDLSTIVSICLKLITGAEPVERKVEVVLTSQNDSSGFVEASDLSISFPIGSVNGTVACTNITIFDNMTSEPTKVLIVSARTVNSADTIQGPDFARIIIIIIIINDMALEEDVDCGLLQPPENGQISYSPANQTVFETVATYSCEDGFSPEISPLSANATANRTCLDSGNWSGEASTCTAVDCGSLVEIANGSVQVNTTAFLSVAIYSCDPGFALGGGDTTRTCLDTGRWSGEEALCQDATSNLPTVGTAGLDVGAGTDLSVIGMIAIAVSVAIGGAVVILVANILLCSLVISKYKQGKSYYFNRNQPTGVGRETYTQDQVESTRVTAIGSLIENVHAITIDGDTEDCLTTTFHPIPEAPEGTNDALVIDNADAGSFGSGSFDDIEDDRSVLDTKATHLQDADTIEVRDRDGIIVMQEISFSQEAKVPQVADIHTLEDQTPFDLQDATPHGLQDATADIEIKDPQLGTVKTLYDACTIDHRSSASSSVDYHFLNLDVDVSTSVTEQEQDNSGDVTVELDGDDYVVEVLI